ncbi:hypothetical protein BVRB_4g084900 [Beta vulgaris subsp. vulgaris]|nr:hypothetical protein BVRB_4g084900 [Beta vulgaris subsp. vulgaris]
MTIAALCASAHLLLEIRPFFIGTDLTLEVELRHVFLSSI